MTGSLSVKQRMALRLARLGFDAKKLRFALRTAIAACLALLLAQAIGLEHPQWAAMTVFAAAQPTRNQLFQKSIARLIGTVIGTGLGLLVLYLGQGNIWVMAISLALWVGLCTACGNLIRGYGSYGTMLAGYSAAMVVLLGQAAAEGGMALGLDRLLTVLVGVAVGIAASWIGGGRLSDNPAREMARLLMADLFAEKAAAMSGSAAEGDRTDHLLSRAARLDEMLDPRAPATPETAATRFGLRQLLAGATELILFRDFAEEPRRMELAARFDALSGTLHASAGFGAARSLIADARDLAEGRELRRILGALGHALASLEARDGMSEAEAAPPPAQHRDFVGAREAGLRVFLVLFALGAFWALTEWPAGSLLMLGSSVMLSVFSTFDNPAWIMKRVGYGQAAGALVSLICLWLVWPLAATSFQMALMMIPFLMVAPFLIAHRKTAPGATDYAMVFLLLLQPSYPVTIDFLASVERAIAVVMGPAFAYLAFRTVFATDEHSRVVTLRRMILGDLAATAEAARPPSDPEGWRALFYLRLLRLLRLEEKSAPLGTDQTKLYGSEAALRDLGETILSLQDLGRGVSLTASQSRAISTALARLSRMQQAPERAARAIDALIRRGIGNPAEQRLFLRTADLLRAKAALIKAPETGRA